MNSPMQAFHRPPLWWITDHFSPRTPDGEYPEGALIPTVAGFPFEIRKIAHMPVERWGHDWDPFGGATAFELSQPEKQFPNGMGDLLLSRGRAICRAPDRHPAVADR
ncbi:MAG: hypothetical protein ACKN9D_03475 [Actinomycetales bacterium]